VLDYKTGFEITFSFFYLIPIAIVTLYCNFKSGMFITAVSVFTWVFSNWMAGESYPNIGIWIWNAGIRLATFATVAYLIHELNLSIEHENLLSRTDFLTGIHNTREFYRLADVEIQRARRYKRSFSVAYLDLDNFKQVNDQFGHRAGDDVLRAVAQAVVSTVRKGDLFARVGGDEFVLLLPETNEENIRSVIGKVCRVVSGQTFDGRIQVSVSIGVVTFSIPPASVDEIIHAADITMYQVKAGTKNNVIFRSVDT